MRRNMENSTLNEMLESVNSKEEVGNEFFELEIDRKQFMFALNLVQGVVEKKNIITILSNIKLSAMDNILTLTATDMDLSICENIGASIKHPGEITVDCKTLTDIIRKMPDEIVTLNYNSSLSQLILTGQNCTFNLSTLPATEFPNLDLSSSDAVQFEVDSSDLLQMFEYTKHSIANESNRYNLNGVCIHKSLSEGADRLAAASADGIVYLIYLLNLH